MRITKHSRLVGRTAEEVKFRENYQAAIVAVQQGGVNAVQPLSSLKFGVGDTLILQVSENSFLLSPPASKTRRSSLFASCSARGAGENKPSTTEHMDVEAGNRDGIITSSFDVVSLLLYI